MPEVFGEQPDDTAWTVREGHTTFDALSAVNAANGHLGNYCVKAAAAYKLEKNRFDCLKEHITRVLTGTLKVHAK